MTDSQAKRKHFDSGELGFYPEKMTDRLEHWAAECPDRVFLGERAGDGWRTITFGEFLRSALHVGEELVGTEAIEIRLRNGIEHAVLAVGAMYAGVPYVPLGPGGVQRAVPVVSFPVVKWLFYFGVGGGAEGGGPDAPDVDE